LLDLDTVLYEERVCRPFAGACDCKRRGVGTVSVYTSYEQAVVCAEPTAGAVGETKHHQRVRSMLPPRTLNFSPTPTPNNFEWNPRWLEIATGLWSRPRPRRSRGGIRQRIPPAHRPSVVTSPPSRGTPQARNRDASSHQYGTQKSLSLSPSFLHFCFPTESVNAACTHHPDALEFSHPLLRCRRS
jgi:hypothetical protein